MYRNFLNSLCSLTGAETRWNKRRTSSQGAAQGVCRTIRRPLRAASGPRVGRGLAGCSRTLHLLHSFYRSWVRLFGRHGPHDTVSPYQDRGNQTRAPDQDSGCSCRATSLDHRTPPPSQTRYSELRPIIL